MGNSPEEELGGLQYTVKTYPSAEIMDISRAQIRNPDKNGSSLDSRKHPNRLLVPVLSMLALGAATGLGFLAGKAFTGNDAQPAVPNYVPYYDGFRVAVPTPVQTIVTPEQIAREENGWMFERYQITKDLLETLDSYAEGYSLYKNMLSTYLNPDIYARLSIALYPQEVPLSSNLLPTELNRIGEESYYSHKGDVGDKSPHEAFFVNLRYQDVPTGNFNTISVGLVSTLNLSEDYSSRLLRVDPLYADSIFGKKLPLKPDDVNTYVHSVFGTSSLLQSNEEQDPNAQGKTIFVSEVKNEDKSILIKVWPEYGGISLEERTPLEPSSPADAAPLGTATDSVTCALEVLNKMVKVL